MTETHTPDGMTETHTPEAGAPRSVRYDPRDAWPAPNARLLNGGQRLAPELPLECFGALAPWLADLAASKGAPVDYVAVPFLAFAASTVGAARTVRVRRGWEEPPILWVASIGNPSAGKSPPLAELKRSLARIEREAAGDMRAKQREHETRKVEAEAHRAAWEASAKEAVKHSRSPAPMPEAAQEPEEPRAPRIAVADVTTEKLARIIADNPRGVISIRDELAGLIGNFGKYGGEDAPFYLSAYSGDFSPVDRVKGGTIMAPRAFLSIVGAIQPDKMQALLAGRANDGLVSRFLPVWPDPKPRVWEVPGVDEARAAQVFARLRSLEMETDAEGELQPRIIPLAPDAAEIFAAWWIEQGAKAGEAAGFMAEFLGKSGGTCARVALVLELMEWAAGANGSTEGPRSVSAASVERACQLFADYLEPMALRVYADSSLPEDERLAVALLKELCRKNVRRFNARELYRGEGWRLPGISSAATANAACAVLEDCDCIKPEEREPGARGRKASSYVVNPHLWGCE